MDSCVFEVPIYRCSLEQFTGQMEKDVAEHLEWLERASGGVTREEAPHTFSVSEEYFRNRYGAPWRYNQVVGWLRICADQGSVWGEVWYVEAKRVRRKMRKHYVWRGRAFKLDNCTDTPSEEIFARIVHEIEGLRRWKLFKRRHFELCPLLAIGPNVDWQGIVGAKWECRSGHSGADTLR